MHVLVVPSFYPTAVEPLNGIFFREQAQALHRRGVRVGLIYPDQRSVAGGVRFRDVRRYFRQRVSDDGGVVVYSATFPVVPKAPRFRAKMWLSQLTRLVESYIAEQGVPDVVHAHGLLWAGVGAVRIGRDRNLPVVITAHSTGFARGLIRDSEQAAIREALSQADAVLAVSSPLRAQLAAYVSEDRVAVVPNLINTAFFSLARRSAGEAFTWLTVADLIPHKSQDVLLEAFGTAFKEDGSVRLRIAGVGPERNRLEQLRRHLGLVDRVDFLGSLTREGVRDELHRSDAFVLPSRHETFGVVVIEAMATGLPVVATRSGGPEDIVQPEVGILVPPDNAEALGEAMIDVYSDRGSWRAREPAIRSYVEERYSEKAVIDAILTTYERLGAGRDG